GLGTMSTPGYGVDESSSGGSNMLTVGLWLADRRPAPPAALAARLRELLTPYLSWPVARVPDACLEAGERLLGTLLISGATERGSALDLLAVDSLVTYAFQAAADNPDRIEVRAAQAMQRISALPHTQSV
ncbi:MAG: hypothetical protein ABMA00_14375, partial [Gemmatimonas sp.]